MINPGLTGLAAAFCCAAAVRGMVMMRQPSAIERRELIADVQEAEPRRGPMRQLIDLLGARLGSRLQRAMSERRRQSIARRLDLAGRPGGMNLESYVELKAALLALGVAFAFLLAIAGSLPAALLWLVCAWLGPEVWLSRNGRLRQDQLERDMPEAYREFRAIGDKLEKHYRNTQDLEFTIERGRLYMLQTRDAKRTAAAARHGYSCNSMIWTRLPSGSATVPNRLPFRSSNSATQREPSSDSRAAAA